MTEKLVPPTDYWKISSDTPLPVWIEGALDKKRLGINDEILDPFEAPFVMKKKVRDSIFDDLRQTYNINPFSFGGRFSNAGFYPLEKVGDYLYLWNHQLHYCTVETFDKKFLDLS